MATIYKKVVFNWSGSESFYNDGEGKTNIILNNIIDPNNFQSGALVKNARVEYITYSCTITSAKEETGKKWKGHILWQESNIFSSQWYYNFTFSNDIEIPVTSQTAQLTGDLIESNGVNVKDLIITNPTNQIVIDNALFYHSGSPSTTVSDFNIMIGISYEEEEEEPETPSGSIILDSIESSHNFYAVNGGSSWQFVTYNKRDSNTSGKFIYQYSDDNGISYTSYDDNSPQLSLEAGKNYLFRVVDANNSAIVSNIISKTINSVPELSVDCSYDSVNTIVDNTSQSFPVVKVFRGLKGITYLNNNESSSSNISVNWIADTQEKLLPISYSKELSSFDLSQLQLPANITTTNNRYFLKFRASYTYETGRDPIEQEVEKVLRLSGQINDNGYYYPTKLPPVVNFSAYNASKNSNIASNTEGFFNETMWGSVTFPKEEELVSKIDQVTYSTSYNNQSIVLLNTTSPNNTTAPEISLANLISQLPNRQTNIPFDITIELRDKIGQTSSKTFSGFNLIRLPGFTSNQIKIDTKSPIPILNWKDEKEIKFIIPKPLTFNMPGTNATEKQVLTAISNKILFEVANDSSLGFDIDIDIEKLDDNNFEYSNIYSEGTLTLKSSYFKKKFEGNKYAGYIKNGALLEGSLKITCKDAFGNEYTGIFDVAYVSGNIIYKKLGFSFGSAPVMPQYDKITTNYKITRTFPIDFSKDEYNLINYQDKLKIVFPKADDANSTADYDDIEKYNIKIYRTDNLENLNEPEEIDSNLFEALPMTSPVEQQEDGRYGYTHTVNNYQESKFIVLGISATDKTGLESNLVIIPTVMIAGRIASPQGAITEVTKNNNGLDLKFKINDLGGNLFRNSSYFYQNYPNLERSYDSEKSPNSFKIQIKVWNQETINPDFEDVKLKEERENSEFITEYTGRYSNLLGQNLSVSWKLPESPKPENPDEGNPDEENLNEENQKTIDLNQKTYIQLKLIIKVNDGIESSYEKEGLTASFVLYPSTPTVAYRKNQVGINTDTIDSSAALEVDAINQNQANIIFRQFGYVSNDAMESGEIIFDLFNKLITGIIIQDSDPKITSDS